MDDDVDKRLNEWVDDAVTEIEAWNRSRVRFGVTVLIFGAVVAAIAVAASTVVHWF